MKRLIFLLLLTTLLIVSAGFSASTSNDKLIVYTNSGDNGRGQWLTEEAKKAGFDIKVVQIGGTTLVNRLLAEKKPSSGCHIRNVSNGLEKNRRCSRFSAIQT